MYRSVPSPQREGRDGGKPESDGVELLSNLDGPPLLFQRKFWGWNTLWEPGFFSHWSLGRGFDLAGGNTPRGLTAVGCFSVAVLAVEVIRVLFLKEELGSTPKSTTQGTSLFPYLKKNLMIHIRNFFFHYKRQRLLKNIWGLHREFLAAISTSTRRCTPSKQMWKASKFSPEVTAYIFYPN